MRLTARIALLERQRSGAPALVQQWTDMLTRLAASVAESDAALGGDDALSPTQPMDPDAIREEAEWYTASGSPATISDLFRLGREMMGDEG